MNVTHPAHDLLGASTADVVARLAQVSGGLTGRRTAQLAGVPWSTARRILERLTGTGLVLRHDAGSADLYTLNRDHLLWRSLEPLFDGSTRLTELIAGVSRRLEDEESSISLYGSVARGESTPASDIDLVIVWGGNEGLDRRETLMHALTTTLERATGNAVEIVDITRPELAGLAAQRDPLITSWAADAITAAGPDLRALLRSAA